MAKSIEAFRTIGEVSEDLDVPKHVLRFWEARFPQIKPMKRGGGRRFYRPEDVSLLKGIHHLLHSAGYTIKGVQRILKDHGLDSVKMSDDGQVPAAQSVAPLKGAAKRKAPKAAEKRDPLSAAQRQQIADLVAELQSCLELARAPV